MLKTMVADQAAGFNKTEGAVAHVYVTEKSGSFSVSPMDSDQWTNQLAMEQLVGTLVKSNSAGNFEPYLAEKWTASADELRWTFKLRDQLHDEAGQKIDAPAYAKNLKRLLRIYARSSTPPTFSQLEGWSEFVHGDEDALGLIADGSLDLTLRFVSRPSGVIEFLSMPYFGFYSDLNFKGDQWINRQKIISSGSYKLRSIDASNITIELRTGGPHPNPSAPKFVHLAFIAADKLAGVERTNTIIATRDESLANLGGFHKIRSPPTILNAIILSPFLPPFDLLENRVAFRTLIRHFSDKYAEATGARDNRSDYFYQIFSTVGNVRRRGFDAALATLQKLKKQDLKVFWKQPKKRGEKFLAAEILPEIQELLGWTFEIQSPAEAGKDWIKLSHSNRAFPIRFASVDIDGAPENWVVEMMFCSTMGVSFPDPNGSACRLVKDFENYRIRSGAQYNTALQTVIEAESVIVPVGHYGISWVISDDISTAFMGSTVTVPRFDLMVPQ